MCITGVADKDGLLLDAMTSLTSRSTRVDGVAVIEAAADRVSFDDLETHPADH